MNQGICIYIDYSDSQLEATAAELVTAARCIAGINGERVITLAATCGGDLLRRLQRLAVDEIALLPLDRDVRFQDDAMGKALAMAIRQISPSSVLVPASSPAKSLFSRVAAILGCGLTADCTGIDVGTRKDGSFYLKQQKPSYGENVMVCITARVGVFPQMLTLRRGVFVPDETEPERPAEVRFLQNIEIPPSNIQLLEETEEADAEGGITAAEIVVIGGRGALAGDSLPLLRRFAGKLGAALGGTRPLADADVIPFSHQIGQTGCTIRPKICLSFGVSGSIQHTEGVKDTTLQIAVNTDENAPIFGCADYGVAMDMNDILRECLKDSQPEPLGHVDAK